VTDTVVAVSTGTQVIARRWPQLLTVAL